MIVVVVVFVVIFEVDDDFDVVVVYGYGVDIVGYCVGVDCIYLVMVFNDFVEYYGIFVVFFVFGFVYFIWVD